MIKEKTCKLLKKISEETAKSTVNDASHWYFYQEDEPELIRQKFLKQEKIKESKEF